MQDQMAVFPVNRNKILRLCQVDHQLQLFPECMARYMNIRYFFIDDVGTLAVEIVDDLADGLFVSRNEL